MSEEKSWPYGKKLGELDNSFWEYYEELRRRGIDWREAFYKPKEEDKL